MFYQNISKQNNRFIEVVKLIGKCDNVIDLACDHAKLALLIKELKIANKVSASDIRPNIINALKNKYNNSDIDFICSDGLKNIPNIYNDVLCILGVGGLKIINILKNADRDFNKYIFIPHRNTLELRNYLQNNKFKILNDYVIKSENKFYFVLEVVKSKNIEKLTKKELYFGKCDLKNLCFKEYLQYELEKYKKILNLNKNAKIEELIQLIEDLIKLGSKLWKE